MIEVVGVAKIANGSAREVGAVEEDANVANPSPQTKGEEEGERSLPLQRSLRKAPRRNRNPRTKTKQAKSKTKMFLRKKRRLIFQRNLHT